MPTLLYDVECFNLNKAELQSVDFTVNLLFVELFNTRDVIPSLKIASISLKSNCQAVM